MDCKNCKEKPCCKEKLMPVAVEAGFIFRAASRLEIAPEKFFERYCDIIPMLVVPPLFYQARICLKQPCPFLKGQCEIHDIKPLACLAFPARAFLEGKLRSFEAYPCKDEDIFEKETLLLDQAICREDDDMIMLLGDKPVFVDLEQMQHNNQVIREYMDALRKDLPWDGQKMLAEKVRDIAYVELSGKLDKKAILERLRGLSDDDLEKIRDLNKRYDETRKRIKI